MKTITHRVRVTEDGTIEFVYDDVLSRALAGIQGTSTIVRASHVEPCDDGVHWFADMSPVGGPKLPPVNSRQEALDAERDWLRTHRGL